MRYPQERRVYMEDLFMKMKLFFRLLVLLGLISASGCASRQGRGGDEDHLWRGYGHEDHWEYRN